MKSIPRRTFIQGLTGVAALTALPGQMSADSPDIASVPLKVHASQRGILYGAASQKERLASDAEFAKTFAQQCGLLVPEGELKWNVLRPSETSYNFAPGDWLCSFAQQHQMKFRGHTLLWHQSLPKWLDAYQDSPKLKQLLLDHITTVVSHYAGKMHSWDVVNEVIEPNDKRPDGLRRKPWLDTIGPDYIDLAFHQAAEADPKAILVWNENHLEVNDSWARAKRAALIPNLQQRLKRKVPIHAVGLQSHIPGMGPSFNNPEFVSFLKSIEDMGLKILITEMDVTENDLPTAIAARDNRIASVYYDYLSTVLKEKSVIAVLTWGLSDRYTWLAQYKPRQDHTAVRPLPLDDGMRSTPTWSAIARAFDEAPAR